MLICNRMFSCIFGVICAQTGNHAQIRNRLKQVVMLKADVGSKRKLCSNWESCSHSRFGHYFCSNLYGRAPMGPRGVKKSDFFFSNKTVEFLH
jgi:hypothetical protein